MNEFLELAFGNTLTRLVFFPAAACLPLLFLRRDAVKAIKGYTFVAALAELVLGILYVLGHGGLAFASSLSAHAANAANASGDGAYSWIPGYGIRYTLAADGISMPLVLLTLLLLPLVIAGSFRGIERHWRAFGASLLLLTTGVLGALLAADLFLFYVFWEVMLVPMYMLIGIWGGERRIYAAVKFFLFTMAGSLLMLIAILWMGFTFHRLTGVWSFAYADLLRLNLPLHTEILLFAAFALTFAIKVPMFPFHTWLPDAHVEAPTGGSVILAGIMLKLGTYGFLRFALPLFPRASLAARPLLVALALAGILYGALVAWVQVDMKKLVAYSSIAHLGFVMLGLLAADALAWQGALLQMINHGLSTGALFLLVGMIYDRRHTKQFSEFGGLAKVMPVFAFFLVFSTLASVGLPLLNGFVGEFLILLGSYRSLGWPAAVATFGVVLAAIYLLKMLQQTIWGPITKDANRGLTDLSAREIWTLVPLCVFMLWIGVAPNAFLAPSRPALDGLLASYQARLAEAPPAAPAVRPRAAERVAALPGTPVEAGR
jgi:NADH-quinone oxidoreductase subunit M